MDQRKNFLVPGREEYTCDHCGQKVMGGRYNNHCPKCLWSKHVDEVVPGDRKSGCLGLMEPVGVTQKEGRWRIMHRCLKCGKKTITKSADDDNMQLAVELATRVAVLD